MDPIASDDDYVIVGTCHCPILLRRAEVASYAEGCAWGVFACASVTAVGVLAWTLLFW